MDSPPPTTPAAPLRRTFASFAFPNYRWFFLGQGTSVVGMWMRDTAQGWLVHALSGSYATLGIVQGISRGALGLATPVGGAVADRTDKRRLLMVLSLASAVLSFSLGALVLAGGATLAGVAVLGALSGAVKGFEIPTRQAFVVEMVGREHLSNAIALNTAMFNSARVLGPLAAGVVMHSFAAGVAACFLVDGATYLAILYSLTRIRPLPHPRDESSSGWRERLSEGADYALGTRRVRTLMLLLLVFVTFGWSYLTVLPAFAKEELGLDARGFGILQALNGAGALLGALWVAAAPAPEGRASLRRTIFATIAISGLAVAVFGLASGGAVAGAALVVAGAGGVGFLSRGNALVQEIVPDRLRGRVMALWVLVFIGGMALGGALLGAAADAWGARAAIAGSGLLCVLLAACVMAGLGPAAEADPGPPPG